MALVSEDYVSIGLAVVLLLLIIAIIVVLLAKNGMLFSYTNPIFQRMSSYFSTHKHLHTQLNHITFTYTLQKSCGDGRVAEQ